MVQVGLLLSDVPRSVSPSDQFRDVLRIVEAAQRNGFTYIAIGQHFLYGDLRWLQPVPLLARLAAEVDPHIRLVTQILIAPLYHPVMLAEEIATLDVVTEGRLVFGAGLGYRPEEFDYLGVPYKERAGRFDESLELMTRLWTEETVTFHGKYWTLDDVHPHLFPVQKPHPPIWIGAHAIPGVRRAAKYGDAYACPPETPKDEVARRYAIVRDGFEARGKTFGPQPLRRNCLVADTREEAMVEYARVAQGRYLTYAAKGLDVMKDADLENEFAKAVAGHAVIGTPDEVVAQLVDLRHRAAGRPAAAAPAVADDDGRRDHRDPRPARPRRRPGDHRDHATTGHRRGPARPHRRGGCDVTAGPLVYTDLVPAFPDPETWTLNHVLRHHVAERPDAMCLDFPDENVTYTYSEALTAAEHVASALYRAGAAQGDRVVLMAQNSSHFVRTWWGTAVGGLVEVPINTNYEGEFLRHQLVVAQARYAVIDDVQAERWVAVAEHARMVERFWVIDTGGGIRDKAVALLRENGWAADAWEELERGDIDPLPTPKPQDLGAIFYTSGTTGPSKGVAMPFSQLYFFAQIVVSLTRLTPDDVYLTTTPLFHGNATFMAVYPVIVAGGRAVIRRKFSASRWIDHVRDSGVTVTNFVGVMMDFAWKQAPRDNDRDNTLRAVYAAPTASTIVDQFKERYGIEAFLDAFGLTETCAPIMSPYGVPRPAGAAGLQNAEWFDIRLVDPETDREVPVGQVGELVVRPVHPWTCSNGYYNMPEKTLEAWRNLWFHTGDALRRDEDGWFYFVDRYKDALRRRGENISSYEVEQAVLQHPAVTECAVLGIPADQEAGEDEVLAVVVVSEPVDPEDVLKWCDGKIPAFAIPRFLRIVDALPKTPSEKVRKSVLRDAGRTADTYDRAAVVAR